MTAALVVYAGTFMRYSLAVTPKNYLLFACHTVNLGAQSVQGYRYLDWNFWGGKEKAGVHGVVQTAKDTVAEASDKVKEVATK